MNILCYSPISNDNHSCISALPWQPYLSSEHTNTRACALSLGIFYSRNLFLQIILGIEWITLTANYTKLSRGSLKRFASHGTVCYCGRVRSNRISCWPSDRLTSTTYGTEISGDVSECSITMIHTTSNRKNFYSRPASNDGKMATDSLWIFNQQVLIEHSMPSAGCHGIPPPQYNMNLLSILLNTRSPSLPPSLQPTQTSQQLLTWSICWTAILIRNRFPLDSLLADLLTSNSGDDLIYVRGLYLLDCICDKRGPCAFHTFAVVTTTNYGSKRRYSNQVVWVYSVVILSCVDQEREKECSLQHNST